MGKRDPHSHFDKFLGKCVCVLLYMLHSCVIGKSGLQKATRTTGEASSEGEARWSSSGMQRVDMAQREA